MSDASAATTNLAPGALLDALFANAPVGLGFWDSELRFRRVNPELAAMNGFPVEAHIGRRPSDLLPDLGGRLEEMFRRVVETGEALRDIDVAGETPSAPGVTRHWLASYFPVTDGSETVGITGLVVEVTGEREANVRADEALRRSASADAELRSLYRALPVGVAFLNTELRYQRVNETLARLNGRSVDDHIGASLEDVLGEPAAQLRPALRQVMEAREPLELELTVPLPHEPEDVRTFEATYFPVVAPTGELRGVGGVVRDVTERQELAAEQSRLLHDALLARAEAEAAQVRADHAREEAERARAEAELGRERLALLARAGREMASSMNWETTVGLVVRTAVPATADWAALTIAEPRGRLRVVAIAHADPARERLAWELVERYPPRPDAEIGTPHVIRTGELEVRSDVTPEMLRAVAVDTDHLRLLESLGLSHVATAPLTTPAGVIGALTFALGESGRRFTAEDLELITSLASRAALHIQNARLYTERSNIAATLQASLRPRALPTIPGAELAARFAPAGEQNEVGGDFYDVFPSGDQVWSAIVGDVSGKGPEAATVTALARHTLRAASMLHDDPAANLALLNRALHSDSPHFCTVLYARMCPGEDGIDIRFSNGGHPAPLLLKPDGRIEAIEAGRGPLVGAWADAEFDEATLQLAAGELLLLYTDGVTEVHTREVDLGERELHATLAAHAGASAAEVVAAVERRAVELQDGFPRDDIAVIAIKAGART